jgi:hypothetical protein
VGRQGTIGGVPRWLHTSVAGALYSGAMTESLAPGTQITPQAATALVMPKVRHPSMKRYASGNGEGMARSQAQAAISENQNLTVSEGGGTERNKYPARFAARLRPGNPKQTAVEGP